MMTSRDIHHVYRRMDSPVGTLTLVATARGLAAVMWDLDPSAVVRPDLWTKENEHPILVATARQLAEYFDRKRQTFDLPLDVAGTAFQHRVWGALRTIPFGETRSYADIAQQIGQPSASRAVGAANGKNPVAIVTPCHRVIGSNGTLTGFAGGIDNKAWLLTHEGSSAGDLFSR